MAAPARETLRHTVYQQQLKDSTCTADNQLLLKEMLRDHDWYVIQTLPQRVSFTEWYAKKRYHTVECRPA